MLDYLFVGAHPDDCEIFAGGTILRLKAQGARVGILDLTAGEAATFGTVHTRKEEYTAAAQLLGLDYRLVLDLPDGKLENTAAARERVVTVLREVKPEVIFTFPGRCRHPDHEAVHHIVRQAAFLSGLSTAESKNSVMRHRPCGLVEFIEFFPASKPSFVVDISEFYEQKKAAVKCFKTQVQTDEQAVTPAQHTTFIRSSAFWDNFNGRLLWFGSLIGVRYGEGFVTAQTLRVDNPLSHFKRQFR